MPLPRAPHGTAALAGLAAAAAVVGALTGTLVGRLVTRGVSPSVGIDVEDISRWREPRRLADLFTPAELARAAATSDPAPHHAGWWAAREAAVKALADEGIALRQVSVAHGTEGAPRIVVAGRPELGRRLSLSLSHSDATAVAVVVRR